MKPSSSRKKKVLVYRTGHLGDTVCAIPAFRLVRQFFADANLTLLCDQPQGAKVAAAEVIGNLGIFDRIHTYTSNRQLQTIWELIRSVRHINPDIAIILPQVSEAIESVHRKIRFFRRCGIPDVRGHNFPALRHAWQPTESDRLVQVLRSIGVRGEKPGYGIPVDLASRESVEKKLKDIGVDPEKPFLLFCGGGKDATQRWPLERYAKVLPVLATEMGWPIVALGNAQETESYRQYVLPRFSGLHLLPAPLNLPELFEICRLAKAFFGNDCGPMHVAASVDCPVAVLMSARALPGAWHPNVTPNLVMRLRLECEGCLLRECLEEKHRCMTGLTEDRVLAEVPEFLRKLPRRPTAA
jgi:ADP-heptose:LPS heptosyltransferase